MNFNRFKNENTIRTAQQPKFVKNYEYLTDLTNLFPRYKFEQQKQKYKQQQKIKIRMNKQDRKLVIQKMIDFDQYKIPADYEVAINHMNSEKVGYQDDTNKDSKYCECCGMQYNKQDIGLLHEIHNLNQLGSGYPLFFLYFQFMVIIIFSVFITCGLFNLVTNIMGSYCKDLKNIQDRNDNMNSKYPYCQLSYMTLLSSINKIQQSKLIFIQKLMNVCSSLLMLAVILYYPKVADSLKQLTDEMLVSPQDYAIYIENVPKLQGINYKAHLDSEFRKIAYVVTSVSMVFDISHHKQQKQKIDDLCQLKKQMLRNQQSGSFFELPPQYSKEGRLNFEQTIQQIDFQIEHIRNQIKNVESSYLQGSNQLFTGKVYVTFESKNQKKQIIEKYGSRGLFSKFLACIGCIPKTQNFEILQKEVDIYDAQEPSDIIWENHAYSYTSKQCISLIVVVEKLLIFTFTTIVIFALYYLQGALNKGLLKNKYLVKYIGSDKLKVVIQTLYLEDPQFHNYYILGTQILIPYLIITFNGFLCKTFYYLSITRKYSTHSEQKFKFTATVSIAKIFSLGALQIGLQYFIFQNFYKKAGLIENQTYLLLVLMVVNLTSEIIYYPYQKTLVNRLLHSGQNIFTYSELQQIYTYPEFNISYLYTNLVNVVYMVMIYATVIPIYSPLILIYLFFLYWIIKYNMLQRSKVTIFLTNKLNDWMGVFISYTIIVHAASNFLFYYQVYQNFDFTIYIQLGVGLLPVLIHMSGIQNMFYQRTRQMDMNMNYIEEEPNFNTDYMRSNPAISETSKINYMREYC